MHQRISAAALWTAFFTIVFGISVVATSSRFFSLPLGLSLIIISWGGRGLSRLQFKG
ncbi:MAG: hypothetical protein LKJ69_08645 [Lactobacillus sp.]|nr:hypothetical protein [Lactobacillus sp.]MCI2033458.1 hypothetical protein [Lactobacillus sp.]